MTTTLFITNFGNKHILNLLPDAFDVEGILEDLVKNTNILCEKIYVFTTTTMPMIYEEDFYIINGKDEKQFRINVILCNPHIHLPSHEAIRIIHTINDKLEPTNNLIHINMFDTFINMFETRMVNVQNDETRLYSIYGDFKTKYEKILTINESDSIRHTPPMIRLSDESLQLPELKNKFVCVVEGYPRNILLEVILELNFYGKEIVKTSGYDINPDEFLDDKHIIYSIFSEHPLIMRLIYEHMRVVHLNSHVSTHRTRSTWVLSECDKNTTLKKLNYENKKHLLTLVPNYFLYQFCYGDREMFINRMFELPTMSMLKYDDVVHIMQILEISINETYKLSCENNLNLMFDSGRKISESEKEEFFNMKLKDFV